jgi:fibronectin type 3 domain-containing protein
MKQFLRRMGLYVALVGVILAPTMGSAQSAPESQGKNSARPVVSQATRSDTTAPLRQLPQIPPKPAVLGKIFQRPFKLLPNRQGSTPSAAPDPVVQGPISEPATVSTGSDFEGVGNVNGVLPPDTVGAVGPNNYVQMVNLSFAIYDRSGNQLLPNPASGLTAVSTNTLWQGFGGPCETRNDGDPVVLYDQLAGRWLMSQFALPRFPRGPFYQCIAVSQTGDPLGQWNRYEFTISQSKLNDYPKFGVWPDGYYMSTNQFKCNFAFCNWAGEGVVAFERSQMLSGGSARMVYFDLDSVDPNLGGMLPSDLDGLAPPANEPNHYAQIDDDAWGYSPDQVQLWDFHVDWSNPSSSTFTFSKALPTAAFDSDMCGYARNCIPQGNTTYKVDAISDRLMFRLQYRNFGDHQTLMLNHTVDADHNDHAGIRWYELRDKNDGNGWGIEQEGTYAPDGNHRWMGSVAMNKSGDIGLGYSVTGPGIRPSIRATGQLSGDTPGEMTQGEIPIVDGSGYQTHSSGRWGDYSSLTVDPADDCTFWYTQEYFTNGASNANWQTRVGSFKLGDCGPAPAAPTAPASLNATAVSSSEIDLTWADNSDNETGFKIERCTGAGCSNFAEVAQVGANVTSYNNTSLTANTTYDYEVVAFNAGGDSDPAGPASATTQQVLPPSAPTGLTATAFSSSQIDLSWTDASDNEDGFKIERCESSNCSFVQIAQVGANVMNYSDSSGLNANTGYTYRVRASNAGGDSAYSNTASATTQAAPAISLTASGYKVRGLQKADLSWGGATGSVDVYRDGSKITTTSSSPYTDNIDNRGSGSYTYRVCEAGGLTTCSNDATVTF